MTTAGDGGDDVDAPTGPPPGPVAADPAVDVRERPRETPFGRPGSPLGRTHPFYIGFVGALGALLAWYLLDLVGALSRVLTLIGVSAFLAIGLDPLVRALQRRGLARGWAVAIVFLGLLLSVIGFVAAVLPNVIVQLAGLARELPGYVTSLGESDLLRQLDRDYGILTNASDAIQKRMTSGETISQIFGGILGAAGAVVSGFFSVISVLVLTLYFLFSLPTITEACYRLVPASRRQRVRLLSNEIIRRIGGYVAGQTAIATINAVLSYVVILILGLPYALVLAITVGLLGLIPLIGATLGAVIVVLVAFSVSWQVALTVAIYYAIYQQIENYVIAPRVMSRTVAVPGSVALIAALAGASLLGILGALISIPIAAAILLIIREVWLPRQERM